MGIIKTVHLIYEYIRHDEEEKVAEVKRAIDGVDLEIEEGSFTAILGHNGSGKSTLAKHINGLLLPTEGTVWVGEIDTKEEDRSNRYAYRSIQERHHPVFRRTGI